MHFNYGHARQKIVDEYAEKGIDLFAVRNKRFCSYINLCIHPYSWEQVYGSIREHNKIDGKTWDCLLGALHGLLVYIKKARTESRRMVSEIAPDVVEFIRSDRVGDPWKFLLSFSQYFGRYTVIRGLETFGLNWRTLAVEVLGARHKPNPKTFHSLLTNLYVRTLLKALTVYSKVRYPHNTDYELGVNDRHSLLTKQSSSKKCVDYNKLDALVRVLENTLPSWNDKVRNQVCYYLSHILPLYYLTEKQLYGRLESNVNGTKQKYKD